MALPTPLRLTSPAARQVSLPSRLREGLGALRIANAALLIAEFRRRAREAVGADLR